MRLFNTLTQTVDPLVIDHPGPVSLYVCGITPYDSAHLGHAFTYHTFDVLTRRLEAMGRSVRSVRNVTDVDDSIVRVAQERGVDYLQLGRDEMERFDRDMAAIGIRPVDAAPRATEYIPQIVEWVRRLEEAGYAYAHDGWVYFATDQFPRYGALSQLNVDAMIALSRERGADPDDPRKQHPLDFVLWQRSTPGEPSWPSPWGEGRPGWHIECSVMSSAELGLPIDIHGGGDDLIYPHHESEIAQVESLEPGPAVRHWMHVATVSLDGTRMSKSLGNLVFVRALLRKHAPDTVRLLLSTHHYRAPWTYVDSEMIEAEERRQRYADAVEREAWIDPGLARKSEKEFFACLDDDLDTAGALEVLDRIVGIDGMRAGEGERKDELLSRLLGVLGVSALQIVENVECCRA